MNSFVIFNPINSGASRKVIESLEGLISVAGIGEMNVKNHKM